MNKNKNKKIVIVGGGTAGWMTASLFAKKWQNKQYDITLIESENIPIIGVGEGSTPYLRQLFTTLEINEKDWMPACNATYKNGIKFSNWSSNSTPKSYYHPFPSEIDALHIEAFEQQNILRRQGHNCAYHPDEFLFMTLLAQQGKSPIPINEFKCENSYGYHFDSALLGQFLAEFSQKLGVKRVEGEVSKVLQLDSGEISAVSTQGGTLYQGDIFVDCTGFNALLIEKTLNVPFISFADNLFNDSAVAIPSIKQIKFMPQTVSTALSSGWAWQIPLQNRTGNGYVYSSRYQSKESAEQELREFIGSEDINGKVKHLKMRVGRSAKHWHKNCLAIGLSQGFIEPLEATALHMTQTSIEDFITAYDEGGGSTEKQQWFNDKVNFNFERIRDFIVLHYLVNTRNDTKYWRDVRNIEISQYLQFIMEEWVSGNDINAALNKLQISQYFSSTSWHCILAGSGIFTAVTKNDVPNNLKDWLSLETIKNTLTSCAKNFSEQQDKQ
ncbi:MAG: tryptophan halogenase family protein [Thalassotalea sp.]